MEEAEGEGDPAGDLREGKGNCRQLCSFRVGENVGIVFVACRFSSIDPLLVFCSVMKMEDLDLPEIKRRKVQEKKAEDKKEFKDLFESDSDSDDGLQIKGEPSLRPHRPPPSPRLFLISQARDAAAAWPLGGRVWSQTRPFPPLQEQQLKVAAVQFV